MSNRERVRGNVGCAHMWGIRSYNKKPPVEKLVVITRCSEVDEATTRGSLVLSVGWKLGDNDSKTRREEAKAETAERGCSHEDKRISMSLLARPR